MNGQLQLNAEQVIVAIQQLSPVEKRKIQRRLPDLFSIPEFMVHPEIEQETTKNEPHQYAFSEIRHLLRDVKGPMSKIDRGER